MADGTYADDKCSGPELADSTLTESDICSGRKATRAVVTQTLACAQQQSLRALLDTVPSAFGADGSGHCDPYDPSVFGEALYRVGESVSRRSGRPRQVPRHHRDDGSVARCRIVQVNEPHALRR
jgi:hypothetical protein